MLRRNSIAFLLCVGLVISLPVAFGAQITGDNSPTTDNTLSQKLQTNLADSGLLDDLWIAVLRRQSDIQFMLKKTGRELSSDAKHISTFQGAPRRGSHPGVLLLVPKTNATPNQDEEYMLRLLRPQADKLISLVRDYERYASLEKSACGNLLALENIVTDHSADASPKQLLELEYSLRSAQRHVSQTRESADKIRLALCILAGEDAVANLDKTLEGQTGSLESMDGHKHIEQFLHGDRNVLNGYDAILLRAH